MSKNRSKEKSNGNTINKRPKFDMRLNGYCVVRVRPSSGYGEPVTQICQGCRAPNADDGGCLLLQIRAKKMAEVQRYWGTEMRQVVDGRELMPETPQIRVCTSILEVL